MNNKILTLLVSVISLIGVALFVNVARIDQENIEAVSDAVSPLVTYSYYLLIVIVLVALVISILSMLKNPAALKKTLLGVSVLAILLAASYMFASDAQVLGPDQGVLVAEGSTSKWVGTGIIFTLILGGIAGASFIVDLLRGIVKS